MNNPPSSNPLNLNIVKQLKDARRVIGDLNRRIRYLESRERELEEQTTYYLELVQQARDKYMDKPVQELHTGG